MTTRNPIELVRQSSRRIRISRVLLAEEIRFRCRAHRTVRHHGRRGGVPRITRERDCRIAVGRLHWENMTVLIQRAVVQCRVGETKVKEQANRRSVELLILPTEKAVEILNKQPHNTNAILHLTC